MAEGWSLTWSSDLEFEGVCPLKHLFIKAKSVGTVWVLEDLCHFGIRIPSLEMFSCSDDRFTRTLTAFLSIIKNAKYCKSVITVNSIKLIRLLNDGDLLTDNQNMMIADVWGNVKGVNMFYIKFYVVIT